MSATHFEHQDKKYARVSAIAGMHKSFAHIDETVLQRKTEIGTIVHKAIESFFSGEKFCLPEHEVCQAYFQGFLKWCKLFKPEIVCTERRLFDEKLRITGQCDLLAQHAFGDLPTVIDFKTCASKDNDVWSVQGFFYRNLFLQEFPNLNKKQVLFVQLTPQGSFKCQNYDCDEKLRLKAIKRYKEFFEKYKEDFIEERRDDVS